MYNHAGPGLDNQDQSIWFFDRQPKTNDNNSLYFTDQRHAGGNVFAFWKQDDKPFLKQEVRQFLIDNAKSLIEEYHVDGLRYDQVTVIAEKGGWRCFAQDLTNTIRFVKTSAVQIAEYWGWGDERRRGVAVPPDGMGFDIGYSDTLRDNLREVISQTTGGWDAHVNLDKVRDALYMTYKCPGRWTVFQCIENHESTMAIVSRVFPRLQIQATRALGMRAAVPRWRPA